MVVKVRFEVLIDDNVEIKQVEKFNSRGAYIDKHGLGETKIKQRKRQSRKVVRCFD